jgi:hypothetical protein
MTAWANTDAGRDLDGLFRYQFSRAELVHLCRFYLEVPLGVRDRDAQTDIIGRRTTRTKRAIQEWMNSHWQEIRPFAQQVVLELPTTNGDERGDLIGPMRDAVAEALRINRP